jgi:hypothetical protein
MAQSTTINELQELRPFPGAGRVPPPRSTFERRHRLARPDLFREAIEQLLAGLLPTEISAEEVRALAASYGVAPEDAYDASLQVWLTALNVFAIDDQRWPVKSEYLRALQEMLGLREEDVELARVQAVAPHFRALLRDVIADRALSEDERTRTMRLADELGIARDVATTAVERTARTLLDQTWHAVTGAGPLNADSVSRMRAAAAALGIEPTVGQEHVLRQAEASLAVAHARAEAERAVREGEAEERRRRAHADRERLSGWLARSSELPIVHAPPSIDLDVGESEVWTERAEWHELLVDQTDPFAGHRLVYQDQGELHITDRRLVFVGQRMLSTIRFSEVTTGVRYPDALRVGRRVDRDVFLLLEGREQVDLLADVLARLTAWPEPAVEPVSARTLATPRPSPKR